MLRPHEAQALLLAKHRPTYCLQILSETLKVRCYHQLHVLLDDFVRTCLK